MYDKIKQDMLSCNLAYAKIDELFEIDGIIHIGIANQENYIAIDCYDDYVIWWTENKANSENFITDYEFNSEDGSSSKQKVLDPSIEFLNIPNFEEYVRYITGQKILKIEDKDWHVEIDLERLLHTYTIVKLYNRHKVPDDLLIAFDKVVYADKYLSKYNNINLN